MQTIETILLVALVLNSLTLVGLIMVQHGQGADAGAAFGAGGSNTVFGSQGSGSFLTRITTWLAIAFFAITFALAWIAKEKAGTTTDLGLDVPELEMVEPADLAPAAPATGDVPAAPADSDIPGAGGR